jgi:hypothetical protein
MIKMAAIKFYQESNDNNSEIISKLDDISTFVGLAIELIGSNKSERAKEALMKIAVNIESVITELRGGKQTNVQ